MTSALVGLRTRDLVQTSIAGLWAAAISAFLAFAGCDAGLAAKSRPAFPNLRGTGQCPALPRPATGRDHVETLDGFLAAAGAVATLLITSYVVVTVPMARRAALARPAT